MKTNENLEGSESALVAPKYKRSFKNYLIHGPLQIYLSTIYLIFFFYGALIAFGVFYWLITGTMAGWNEREALANQLMITRVLQVNGLWFLLVIAACAALTIPLGILLTHKIGGPVFVIRRQIRALVEGDFSARIHLRKEDYLVDVMEDLNRLADRLETGKGGPR